MRTGTLEQAVQVLLQNVTGTIGEFQNCHFVIARDEKEIQAMSSYRFIDNNLEPYFPDYHQLAETRGTLLMGRRPIDIPRSLADYGRQIETKKREGEEKLDPTRRELAGVVQRRDEIRKKAEKARFLRWRFISQERVLSEQVDKLEREIQQQDEWGEWQKDISFYERRQLFFRHLAARYGENTTFLLQGEGVGTFDLRDHKNHDSRPLTPVYINLFGSSRTTQYLFDIAAGRIQGNIVRLSEAACRRTPYMATPIAEYLGYPDFPDKQQRSGYRDESYRLFDKTRRLCLYDAPTRTSLTIER